MPEDELSNTFTDEKIRLAEPTSESAQLKAAPGMKPEAKPLQEAELQKTTIVEAAAVHTPLEKSTEESRNVETSIARLEQSLKTEEPGRLHVKDRDDAHKILKELPTDEFLNLLEQASPEQLQTFLNLLGNSDKKVPPILQSLFSSLTNVPEEPRGAASIVAWWEARRFVFNLVVGLCGLPTLAIVYLTGLADLGFAISGSIEYGILANICYSAGWICELTARSWWKERAKHLGPILFTLGFAFSIFITLGAGLIMILIFCALSFVRGI